MTQWHFAFNSKVERRQFCSRNIFLIKFSWLFSIGPLASLLTNKSKHTTVLTDIIKCRSIVVFVRFFTKEKGHLKTVNGKLITGKISWILNSFGKVFTRVLTINSYLLFHILYQNIFLFLNSLSILRLSVCDEKHNSLRAVSRSFQCVCRMSNFFS